VAEDAWSAPTAAGDQPAAGMETPHTAPATPERVLAHPGS
jgi:hypothetical protein